MNKADRKRILVSLPEAERQQCMKRIQKRLVLPSVVFALLAMFGVVLTMLLIMKEPSQRQVIGTIAASGVIISGLLVAGMVLRAPRLCDEEIERVQRSLAGYSRSARNPEG